MKISGFQKNTLLDYPGKTSALIFTQGCNFRCGYCHNPEELNFNKKIDNLEKEVLNYLQKRQGKLDALVISGGEPTMQPDLENFIKKVKKMGYLVKLDTNGSNPKKLKKLITEKLIDAVAMDIKAPLYKYALVVGANIDVKKIEKSIKIIINSGIEHEFRTTVLPFFHQKRDIISMARLINGAQKYYLQNFIVRTNLVNPIFKTAKSYSKKELESLARTARNIIGHCEVRGTD